MFIILLLKLQIFLLRTFTSNSATALPGLMLEKFFPNTLRKLLKQFDQIIFVTGTNGKTTTSRILVHLLQKNNISYVSNTSGSNMIRGIASVVLNKSDNFGHIREKIAVFEVEEATMPKLVNYLIPDIIIVTNIFRDQLDAYGEIDKTYSYIKEAIIKSDNPKLILNNDDNRVKELRNYTTSEVDLISFDEKYLKLIKFENKESLEKTSEASKMGNKFIIKNIKITDDLETTYDLFENDQILINGYKMKVPGYHNTFNSAAALISFFALLKKDNKDIKNIKNNLQDYNLEIEDFVPVFGRGEIVKLGNINVQILLVKNPAGMNLNLKLLENVNNREAVLFILNDKIADGTDVSWIWDCDFSILKKLNFKKVYVAGERCWDMALRIQYEGIKVTNVYPKYNSIIAEIENDLNKEGINKVFVLPTYTAMREFRKQLSKNTKVEKIWK